MAFINFDFVRPALPSVTRYSSLVRRALQDQSELGSSATHRLLIVVPTSPNHRPLCAFNEKGPG
jgi:hypothetical protein